MKKIAKRSLAVLLSLLMILTSFAAASAELIETVGSGSMVLYVPEAVYLAPSSAGSVTAQWYLNNTDGSGNYSYARGAESTGKFYFHCSKATSISVSASFESGGSLSNLTTSTGGATLNDDNFQIAANNTNQMITWRVDYTCNDGVTRTAWAYTYVYKPNRIPTGVASEAESEKHGGNRKYDYHGFVSVLWGANGYDEGQTQGNEQAKGPAEMIFMGNNGMKSAGNTRPHNAGYFNDSNPKTFRYHNNDNKKVTVSSPYAHYYVDVSRYSNMNQIPNMNFGLAVTDDEHTDGYALTTTLQNVGGTDLSVMHSRTEYNTEVVVFNENSGKKPNYNISGITLNAWTDYRIFTLGYTWCGGTRTESKQYIYFNLYNNNKSTLRNYYFDCIKSGYSMQQERFTSSSWNTYISALRHAGYVLGNPVVTYSDVTWAYNNLVNARNGLQVKTHTAKARHLALNNTGANSYIVANLSAGTATTETLTYTGGNTLTAKNNSYAGYSLCGYKADWNDTVNGTAYNSSFSGITRTYSAVINNYRSDGDKYYTFYYTPNLYTVSLNGNGATSGGTGSIYCSYGNAFYKDASYAQKMTTSANGISVPSRTGYFFDGFYNAQNGGTQMITANGFLTSAANTSASASNVTWYAHWTPITYTVNYNGNGATSGSTAASAHAYGSPKALTANGFKRTGFTFIGWSDAAAGGVKYADGASVNNLTAINGATVDLFAVWTVNKYIIAYDGNGATSGSTAPTECTYNIAAGIAENGFNRTGYTFTGWSTTPNGSVEYRPGDTVRNLTEENGRTITLYAVWTPIKYRITFKNYDGTVLATQMVDYDSVPVYGGVSPEKPVTAESVFTFAGWSPELAVVKGEAEYTAQFTATPRPYLIRFVNEDNTELYRAQVPYGTVPEYKGETPTKASTQQYSYLHDGWTTELVPVTGSAVYKAKFKPVVNRYTAKFLNGNGTVIWETTLDYGSELVYGGETPTKEKDVQFEYTFSGWNKVLSPVVADVTYEPRFTSTVRSYTVRFENHDGALLKEYTVKYGDTPVYDGDTPVKESTVEEQFAFAGWDKTVSVCTGNAVYTAQFTASPRMYKITFVNYDGSVVKETEFGYGSNPSCDITPSRPADNKYTYTFFGWGYIASVTGEATYMAQYTYDYTKHIIKFVNYDGTVLQATEIAWGETPVYEGDIPSKPKTAQYSYSFAGWDKEIETVTEPAVYTAVYDATVNSYTVIFKNYDGEVFDEQTVNYGETPVYKGEATPVKPADVQFTYTFKDWGAITPVTGDAEYTAQYIETLNKYTVQFVSEDGSEIYDEQVLDYGTMPVYAGETPVKAKTAQYTYTFKGWDKDVDIVTGDIAYAARFDATVNKYTVKFVNEDGSVLDEQTVDYGTIPVFAGEAPVKASDAQYTYVWNGWDKEVGMVLDDTVYTAHFDKILNYYTITFKNYDGTVLQDDDFGYGSTPAYNGETPEKAGTAQYTFFFAGWTPEIDTVTGEAVYTAKYTAVVNKYHVIFKDYDGTVLQDTELEYGSMPRFNGTAPEREPDDDYIYTFAGWKEEFKPIVGETVFNAKYSTRTNKFTIKFVNYNGEVLLTKSYKYGEMPVFDGTPARANDSQSHYTFIGWDKPLTAVTGFTTYVAVFAADAHSFDVIAETAPTCTESGKKTYKCSVCGFTFDQETAAKGHDLGDVVIDGDKAYKECKTCGEKIEVPMAEAEKEQSLCKWCGKYHYKWIRPDFGRLSCIISQFFSLLAKFFTR